MMTFALWYLSGLLSIGVAVRLDEGQWTPKRLTVSDLMTIIVVALVGPAFLPICGLVAVGMVFVKHILPGILKYELLREKAEMEPGRWHQLMEFDDLKLTTEEIKQGWHFCHDWDGLLIGPGMAEQEACLCRKVTVKIPIPTKSSLRDFIDEGPAHLRFIIRWICLVAIYVLLACLFALISFWAFVWVPICAISWACGDRRVWLSLWETAVDAVQSPWEALDPWRAYDL